MEAKLAAAEVEACEAKGARPEGSGYESVVWLACAAALTIERFPSGLWQSAYSVSHAFHLLLQGSAAHASAPKQLCCRFRLSTSRPFCDELFRRFDSILFKRSEMILLYSVLGCIQMSLFLNHFFYFGALFSRTLFLSRLQGCVTNLLIVRRNLFRPAPKSALPMAGPGVTSPMDASQRAIKVRRVLREFGA